MQAGRQKRRKDEYESDGSGRVNTKRPMISHIDRDVEMKQANLFDERVDPSRIQREELIQWVHWARAQNKLTQAAIRDHEHQIMQVKEQACIDANARMLEFRERARLYKEKRDSEKHILSSQITQLEAEVATFNRTLRKSKEEAERMKCENDRLCSEHETMKQNVSRLCAQNKDLASKVAKLKEDVETSNTQNLNNLERLREMKERFREAAHSLKQSIEQNELMSRKQGEMELVKHRLLAKIVQLRARATTALKELEESEDFIAETASAHKHEIEQLNIELAECHSERGVLASEINGIDSQRNDVAITHPEITASVPRFDPFPPWPRTKSAKDPNKFQSITGEWGQRGGARYRQTRHAVRQAYINKHDIGFRRDRNHLIGWEPVDEGEPYRPRPAKELLPFDVIHRVMDALKTNDLPVPNSGTACLLRFIQPGFRLDGAPATTPTPAQLTTFFEHTKYSLLLEPAGDARIYIGEPCQKEEDGADVVLQSVQLASGIDQRHDALITWGLRREPPNPFGRPPCWLIENITWVDFRDRFREEVQISYEEWPHTVSEINDIHRQQIDPAPTPSHQPSAVRWAPVDEPVVSPTGTEYNIHRPEVMYAHLVIKAVMRALRNNDIPLPNSGTTCLLRFIRPGFRFDGAPATLPTPAQLTKFFELTEYRLLLQVGDEQQWVYDPLQLNEGDDDMTATQKVSLYQNPAASFEWKLRKQKEPPTSSWLVESILWHDTPSQFGQDISHEEWPPSEEDEVSAITHGPMIPTAPRLSPIHEVQDRVHAEHENPVPKYVAHGMSGCVFRPAIICTCDDPDPTIPKISKIFKRKENMLFEEQYNRIIGRIDPYHHFTLQCFGSCPIDRNEFPDIHMCNFGEDEEPERHQLVFEDGGDNLDMAVTQHNFTDIFKGLSTVFDGVQEMARSGFVHLDLKPPNMVFRANNKVAVIDFGLSMTFLEFQNKRTFCVHPYEYYPPEFPMLAREALKRQNYPDTHTDQIRNEQNSERLFIQVAPLFTLIKKDPASSVELKLWIRQCNRMLLKEYIDEQSTEKNVYSPNKIDVYSLGASILILLATSHAAKLAQINNNPAFYIDVLKLCRRMIHPSPLKRIDASAARRRYIKIIETHQI